MSKLRILLADDHETVREGLKAILNAQPDMEVVGEAPDGAAAIAQSLDLDAGRRRHGRLDAPAERPEGDRDAPRALSALKILTLTRHSDQGYVQQLLGAGASGYVLKQSRAAELLHAIRAVAAGGAISIPGRRGA